MRKKKSDIHSLLAARIRPARRSPSQSGTAHPATHLRLSRDDHAIQPLRHGSGVPAPTIAAEQIVDRLIAASDLLDRADAGLRRIRERVEVFRNCWRAGQGPSLEASVDRAIQDSQFNGTHLFDGSCEINLAGILPGDSDRLGLPFLNCRELGKTGAGALSDLTREEAPHDRVQTILTAAAESLDAHQRGVHEFGERVREELNCRRIALENIHAARQAGEDAGFAVAASRVGHLDILAAAALRRQKESLRAAPALRWVSEGAVFETAHPAENAASSDIELPGASEMQIQAAGRGIPASTGKTSNQSRGADGPIGSTVGRQRPISGDSPTDSDGPHEKRPTN